MQVRRPYARVAAAIVALAIAVALMLRARTPDVRYVTAAVERGDILDVVGATGTLQAVTTVQVGSQVSGTIQSLYADFNSVIALGSGARASIDEQIQSQGTNVVYVSAGSFGRGAGAVRGGAGRAASRRSPSTIPVPSPARCRRWRSSPRWCAAARRSSPATRTGTPRWKAATRTTSPSATGSSGPGKTSPPATCSSRTRCACSERASLPCSSPIPIRSGR